MVIFLLNCLFMGPPYYVSQDSKLYLQRTCRFAPRMFSGKSASCLVQYLAPSVVLELASGSVVEFLPVDRPRATNYNLIK